MSFERHPTDLDQPSPVQGTLQSRLDIAPTNLEFSNAATWCLMQFVSSHDFNFLATNVQLASLESRRHTWAITLLTDTSHKSLPSSQTLPHKINRTREAARFTLFHWNKYIHTHTSLCAHVAFPIVNLCHLDKSSRRVHTCGIVILNFRVLAQQLSCSDALMADTCEILLLQTVPILKDLAL